MKTRRIELVYSDVMADLNPETLNKYDGLVVYDGAHDRVHYLNVTASVVFSFCDGAHTVEEIAEAMSKGQEVVVTPEKVREIIKVSQEPVSLETPIGEEEDSHLGDFIEDQEAVVPADAASYILMQEQLEAVLHTLSEREQKVIRWRFGLVDGTPLTLEQVGEKFHVTRERIRQIEAKALRKLRHPSRSRALRDYME